MAGHSVDETSAPVVATTSAFNPYVGPRPFNLEDLKLGRDLFGRDWETSELLDLLIGKRIVLLHSPSGAGKTSLVEVKLIPALEAEGFEVLPVIRVGQDPVAGGDGPVNRYLQSVATSLELIGPVASEGTPTGAAELVPSPTEGGSQVLVFDQFEEIFSIDPTDRAEKLVFFLQLGTWLRHKNRWALFLIREDYLGELDPYEEFLPTRLTTRFRLNLLDKRAALLAIREPAARVNVTIAEPAARGLVDELSKVRVSGPGGKPVERPGDYVEPVQLQVVCIRLWERLVPMPGSHIDDLKSVGSVDETLADYYAERVAAVAVRTATPERAIRSWVGQNLITPEGVRGQVLREPDQSKGLDNEVIAALLNVYLVRAEPRRGMLWYELSHDRLIGPVRDSNTAWFEQHLSPLQTQAELWQKQQRLDGLLLRGEALQQAEIWAAEHSEELTEIETDFVEECRAARRRAKQEKRLNRQIRWLAVVACVMVGIVAVLGLWAWNTALRAQVSEAAAMAAGDEARRQTNLATARGLVAAADGALAVDPERSILLALEAVRATTSHDQPVTTEAVEALHRAVQASHVVLRLSGHSQAVRAVAVRRDGAQLATASYDRTVKIWDLAASGATLHGDLDHTGEVLSIAFSHDGTQLASGTANGWLTIWDIATQKKVFEQDSQGRVAELAFSQDDSRLVAATGARSISVWDITSNHVVLNLPTDAEALSVAFSPDGTLIAGGAKNGAITVWDAASGLPVQRILYAPSAEIAKLAFSPDGTRLAAGSYSVKVWDTTTWQELLDVAGNTSAGTNAVAFSPDSKSLATGGGDRIVRIWDLRTRENVFTLAGHADIVRGLVFLPGGHRLSSVSDDSTVRVWDVTPMGFHTQPILDVAFSPDGALFATASKDQTAEVWNTANGAPFLIQPLGHDGWVYRVAFNPTGLANSYVVTGSADRTAGVWDLHGVLQRPLPHTDEVSDVAFTRDGARLATASRDGMARVWDGGSGALYSTLSVSSNGEWVNGVAFSADGSVLATASSDGTVKLWEVAAGPQSQARATLGEAPNCSTIRDPSCSTRTHGVGHLAFSQDGQLLATAYLNGQVAIWDVSSTRPVQKTVLDAHAGKVSAVAFSPDGKLFATGGADGKAKIWDLASLELRLTLSHAAAVNAVAFRPDGKFLMTAGDEHQVNMHPLEFQDLIDLAQSKVTRKLTGDECLTYLHQPCPEVT